MDVLIEHVEKPSAEIIVWSYVVLDMHHLRNATLNSTAPVFEMIEHLTKYSEALA